MSIPPVTIKSISGLWNSPNPFSKVPEGALAIADECVIRANGVLESRRGYDSALIFPAPSKVLPLGDTRVLFMGQGSGWVSGMAVFDTDQRFWGGFTYNALPLAPIAQPPPYASDPRVSYQLTTANRTAYSTTNNGITAQTAVGSYMPLARIGQRAAGLPQPPAPLLTLVAAAGNAVFNTAKRRTYRLTVAMYDSVGNFYESAPSEPVYIENTSGVDKTVQIQCFWPIALGGSNTTLDLAFQPFFRVWRSLETTNGVPANDEMFLIREAIPAPSVGPMNPATGMTFNDVSIDGLLNVPLYTNPQTGDGFGILSANHRPPVAGALAYFKGRMYYGRPTFQQSLTIQIIGTGTGGVVPGDTILIDGITYTAGGAGLEASQVFNCPTGAGAVAQNIETAARSLVECIRQAYASGPGSTRQNNRQLYAYYASSDVGGDFGRIIMSRPLPIPLQDSPGISFGVTVSAAGVSFPLGSTTSTDDYIPGGLSWSKPDQPEAVPDINFDTVGDANRAVLGFSVHRDAMIIYKEDGAYILRDDGSPIPTIDLLDASVVCVAPDTIRVVSNLAYVLAQRGVLQVSEQGTELVSYPIFDDLDKLYRLSSNQLAGAFAVAHESERLYILALPASAQETTCSVQYVLRVPEQESPLPKWTPWRLPGLTCGCVVPQTNKLVFGFNNLSLLNVNFGFLIERRGNVGSLDYCDTFKANAVNIAAPSSSASTVLLSGDLRQYFGSGDLLLYNPGGAGTKVYMPRILSVAYDSTANKTTITLDQTVPFAGGTFSFFPSIRAHWRFLPITGGEPTYEKQITYLQAYFPYFDGDWLDAKLDSESTPLSGFSQVYADPRNSNLGGQIALSFPGSVSGDPSPPSPLNTIQWWRNCKDVSLRVDPASSESRGIRFGVEMQFAQALASFRLAAISADVGEANATGGR